MKKLIISTTFLFISVFLVFSQEKQPDYTVIKFKKKIQEYKKSTPKLEGSNISKEYISEIVDDLGKAFYSKSEREEIVEKIWLAFIDPKKFDMVHRDYAIRSLPNWDKKNFRGEIVLEPNIYLKDWTEADTELDYFKIAMHRILMLEGLMGYGEDAKNTRKSLKKVRYISKYTLPQPTRNDWTNSYLEKLSSAVSNKGLSVMITHGDYEFLVCKNDQKEKLVNLFKKMKWDFVSL